MISQPFEGAWNGGVCNQPYVTKWQNAIPYGGTTRHIVVIIRSHCLLTGKCYHQNCRTQKANKHCKCCVLMQKMISKDSDVFADDS